MKDFYNQKKWLDKRKHILKRDAYMDQLEKRAGKNIPADVVHHIFPREQYPEYTWEDWNLISISWATHRSLHLLNGQLSPLGEMLKKEVAKARGIKFYEKILVIGLPGSGKTTWAKANLHNGLCYDLDYIAAAFRLKKPKEENDKQARLMANAMVKAFSINAERYASRIIIIRTAPTIEELSDLEIDRIVYCKSKAQGMQAEKTRLEEALEWAKLNKIPVEVKIKNDSRGSFEP